VTKFVNRRNHSISMSYYYQLDVCMMLSHRKQKCNREQLTWQRCIYYDTFVDS